MADKKRAKKIDRRETRVIIDKGYENFQQYVSKFSDKRLFLRLVHGRKIKPCGRECREYGYLIAEEFSDHSSFENFPELMNDKEFILKIAQTSRNPATCKIYFYDYVNHYLKLDKEFRLKFLKAIYLNENVYTLEDITTIVDYCEFHKENETILSDIEFKRLIQKRFNEVDYRDKVDYHCSGENEKELHAFKVEANEMKILCENMKKGLQDILNSFTVGKNEEKQKDEEPTNFYEYLCSKSKPFIM